MDQLVNYFMSHLGMSSDEAKRQALFYMNRPSDTMTKYFMTQAQAAGIPEISPVPAPGAGPPGAIVMPVGGKPQTITVADIANGAPPSMAEFGSGAPARDVYSPKTPPRDLASGTPISTRNSRVPYQAY